jgi:predicted O-methyltransferase YrrM
MPKTVFNQLLSDIKDAVYPNRVIRFRSEIHPALRMSAKSSRRILGGKADRRHDAIFEHATFTQNWFFNQSVWDAFLPKDVSEYLEIGSFEGRSALYASQLFPKARLTCIDTFGGSSEHLGEDLSELETRFLRNIEPIRSRVKVLKGTSLERLSEMQNSPEMFDVIYIDGHHFYRSVLMDTLLSWPLLKTGGILIWDDYTWEFDKYDGKNPKPAIDQFLTIYRGDYEPVFVTNQAAIRKTKSELRYL